MEGTDQKHVLYFDRFRIATSRGTNEFRHRTVRDFGWMIRSLFVENSSWMLITCIWQFSFFDDKFMPKVSHMCLGVF